MAGLLHTRPNCTTLPAWVSLHLTDQVWLEVLQYTYPFDQPTKCHQETALIDSVLALYISCLAKADNASFRDWVIVREDTGNLKNFTSASWCSCSFDQWLHACTYSLHALTSSQSIVLLVPDCSWTGLGRLIEAWRHGSSWKSLASIGSHGTEPRDPFYWLIHWVRLPKLSNSNIHFQQCFAVWGAPAPSSLQVCRGWLVSSTRSWTSCRCGSSFAAKRLLAQCKTLKL